MPISPDGSRDSEENVDSRTPLIGTRDVPAQNALATEATALIGPREAGIASELRPAVVLQSWTDPPINRYRYFVTVFSFIVMGMNDGVVGALLPYLEDYYQVSYTVISLVFMAPFFGYLLAALSNSMIHYHFGQRGVAVLAPLAKLLGYSLLATHPPFPLVPIVMLFSGFGNGLEDSGWNAWVGNMQNANELLGFLHGAYGIGAMAGPLVGTVLITKGNLPWYTFYYLMIGIALLELVASVTAFWKANGEAYRDALRASRSSADDGKQTSTRTVLRNPITWMIALFLLGYVGAEVSLSGWIVEFMLVVRHADPFLAGLAATFFYMGLTFGRIFLGLVTGRVGEKLAITTYIIAGILAQIIYWKIPSPEVSMVFVTFLGFAMGPLFPTAIVATTKLLPSRHHVAAISFAAAFGQIGAAIFPFGVGAIAEGKGVEVLQPIVLAIFVFILAMWWLLPGGLQKDGLERARENEEPVGAEVVKMARWIRKRVAGNGEERI